MTAKLTWLGENEGYRAGETPPAFTTWNGIVFRVGEPVEVTDPHMIAKAKGNRFFQVEEQEMVKRGQGRPRKVVSDGNL